MENIDNTFQAMKRHFFEVLQAEGYKERLHKLNAIEKWLLAHRAEICAALRADLHKPEVETEALEIHSVLSEIRECRAHLYSWMQPRFIPAPIFLISTKAKIVTAPKGLVLILSPWNYPFMLCIGPLVSALAAGNGIILKPSENAPQTANLIATMVNDLFNPLEVKVMQGGPEIASELTHKAFDHIFFTGSPEVGKKVMHAAAENLVSITLELGGMNPAIVDESADIKDTAKKLMIGKLATAGQSCLAPNHVFVHSSIFQKLSKACKDQIESYYGPADRQADNPDLSHIINSQHFKRIQVLFEDAISKGAKVLAGGFADESKCFLAPTVLSDVPENARVRNEEVFGPLLSFIPYDDLQSVIHQINTGEKPLALYVFSRQEKQINFILNHTQSGTAGINETSIQFLHPGLPFGGIGHSGMGQAHGHFGFKQFSHERAVLRNKRGLNSISLMLPPYTSFSRKVVNLLLRWF